ncbi:MAG: ArsA family ATPase [Deltaproteobacteria bacterium]|nr:ArsA family ATPase [Deltaproteobacteria bacterium]
MELIKALLSYRLIIITGKGGVGRSTLTASLAIVAARMGRRVLVVERAPVEQMSGFFGRPELGYDGGVLMSGIHAMNLDPQLAFREYMLTQVRLETVYRKLFENSIMRSFLHFIPGLNDLMCMGKVLELSNEIERDTHRRKYDVIIFDGPSSAQAVAMLQTPLRVARIARMGPIKKHSRAIAAFLEDPSQTALCVVTQPEELAIREAEELLKTTRNNLNISIGPVIANAIPPQIFSLKELKAVNGAFLARSPSNGHKTLEAWIHYAGLAYRQAENARRQLDRLRRSTPSNVIEIPFVLDERAKIGRVQAIADYMWTSL